MSDTKNEESEGTAETMTGLVGMWGFATVVGIGLVIYMLDGGWLMAGAIAAIALVGITVCGVFMFMSEALKMLDLIAKQDRAGREVDQ